MAKSSHLPAILLFPLFILLGSCSFDTSLTGGYAVVYGVSLYNTGLSEGTYPNLTYSNDDAVSVAAMFEDANYQVILRTDTQATPANLVSDMEYVADRISSEENFVFYFSGHGVGSNVMPADGDASEPAGMDRYDEWIFLYGSIDISGYINGDAALSDDGLLSLIATVPTARRIVILDACSSGGFIGSQTEIDLTPQNSAAGESEGFSDAVSKYFSGAWADAADIPSSEALLITAAGEQEDTYETTELGHGIFTYFLLRAPLEADDNDDGFLTVGECFRYASLMIEDRWGSSLFTPRISGGPVDLVLFESAGRFTSRP